MNARTRHSLIALLLLAVAGGGAWVVAGLLTTLDPNAQPVGYLAQPGADTHTLYTGNQAGQRTRVYAIDYDAQDWSGNVHSYPLSAAGTLVKADDWGTGAAAKIDIQAWSDQSKSGHRKIVTRDGPNNANVAFRWQVAAPGTTKLSDAQKALLDPGTSKTATKSLVLDYLRGDRSSEGAGKNDYRPRSTVLGDIIHSTPVYWDDGTRRTVFVGSNDGMVHAINAADGTERFAYIPSMLLSRLSVLTDPSYAHEYFVDGRMDIRKFGNQTILAGALGSGGKGLFGLDITNANASSEADAASKILWEITNASSGFTNLGYTYGQPVLATLPDGKPALLVGNGYGNTGSSYGASLFVINPVTGALIAEIVPTDAASLGIATNRNGLSSPTAVDTDLDGNADVAYAGDLKGNLWKFDLKTNTAKKLFTTDGGQAITMAPGLVPHPNVDGSFIITFATGRMLVASDTDDTSIHAAYGIWEAAPVANTALLTQTLTEEVYTPKATRVRRVTANVPDWAAHKGWKTELPIGGERVVGDGAFVTGGNVFMFISTNPTIPSTFPNPPGENWWMQLNARTGGDNGATRFDLDRDGKFTLADQLTVGDTKKDAVGLDLGGGVRSQMTAFSAGTFDVFQANYDKNSGVVPTPTDKGVSGGHFDFDIYYYTGQPTIGWVASGASQTIVNVVCASTIDVTDELLQAFPRVNNKSPKPTYCVPNNGFNLSNPPNELMTDVVTGAACGGAKAKTNLQTITCSQYTTDSSQTGFSKVLHVHEYDDKYDVTGVNMQAASNSNFNLANALPVASTPFKMLVMNQFLNPAAKLAIGLNATEVSVKTYGNLASETDAQTLLDGLTIHTPAGLKVNTPGNVGSFIYNLPLNAFLSKDWWGTGGDGVIRAGLIPTQTGCVNGVGSTGASSPLGFQGERHNGALTLQLIESTTPATALELNVAGDVRYGWRVKAANFTQYVLAEYTSFWHHPNGICYPSVIGNPKGWVPNPPQDFTGSAKAVKADPNSSDPKGVFGAGGPQNPIVSVVTKNGITTTTYADGTQIIKYPDGTVEVKLPDGTVINITAGVDTGFIVSDFGVVDPKGGYTPEKSGRINWRELRK